MTRFKFFLALLCVILLGTPLWAQEDLSQAEQAYRSGKYAQALGAYEQILKNHPKDPYLYYNIGNCYFKMGSKGLATAYYYRAFKLAPRDSNIRYNLALALNEAGNSLVPRGIPPVVHRAFFILSLEELKGLVCLTGWGLCLGVGWWLLTRKAGKLVWTVGILFVLCAGWFYARHSWETQPLAVVASPVAEIRSGPGLNFPPSASVPQGHLVEVLDRKDHWQEVIVRSQGIKGWVEQTALEHI